jgi:hypothetical protein
LGSKVVSFGQQPHYFFGQQKLFIMGSQIIFWAARLIIWAAIIFYFQILQKKIF